MELNRQTWSKMSIEELEQYLYTLSRPNKVAWTQNINRTSMPLLAIESSKLRDIAKEIHKGNSFSFLDNCTYSNYELTAICGYLLNYEKDFETIKKYLFKYLPHIDCWASCDILKLDNRKCKKELFELAQDLTNSDKTFVRRAGLKIMFSYAGNKEYTERILNTLNSFYDEKEYYVNMIVAWLFCEMFIKERHSTIEFLKTHNLNNFAINKGIQKCRDSYRVSKEDKEMLLKYKKYLD